MSVLDQWDRANRHGWTWANDLDSGQRYINGYAVQTRRRGNILYRIGLAYGRKPVGFPPLRVK